ncbi:MAG: preprotein translocase subunit YajC [Sphingomonadaceae bacterium]|nr:preprotein translocase subunit YajC [Sphingomonadaceae bacterium]
MTSDFTRLFALLCAGTALSLPLAAHAQSIAYGDVSSSPGKGAGERGSDSSAGAEDEGDVRPARGASGKKIKVTPYIEAQQVVFAELKPGDEVLTYSVLAAGVDAAIAGRNNQASVSLRYERRIGWGDATDSDAISGVARASLSVVPQTLKIEAGALAARTSVENNGAAVTSGLEFGDSVTQIYSIYAGPQLATNVGDVALSGSYRLGYTRVESPDAIQLAPGQAPIDVFDDSVTHNAAVRAGVKPGAVLPAGLGVGAGYNREDVSNLDQQIEDRWVRGDVTVPVTPDLHLVGGVGYEKVQVSSRDAIRDPVTGNPVLGNDGRFVTDKSVPRTIAYNADGLIWDAGVMWRPSRRTALEAHVGKRYGSTSYYGSFAYAPNARTSFNISVYDSINGFGGQLNNALAALPTEFEAVRNPFNGSLSGCVAASGSVASGQSPCLSTALGSVRSSVFRSRGVMASYTVTGSRFQTGFGAGYDRRKFIAAPGTVLAAANGVIDENFWVAAYLNGRIDRNSSFSTSVYGNLYESGDAFSGDITAIGATAAYYRQLTSKLTATAAIGIDGVKRENLVDIWSGQAMVGVRYSF